MADLELTAINASLRQRGIRMLIEQRRQALTVRGTFPEPDGTRRRRRLPLDLRAEPANLITAELRCLELHNAIRAGTYPPTIPWASPPRAVHRGPPAPSTLTCSAAIASLQQSYWQSRARTAAAERTWQRTANELRRLPPSSPCTLQLLRDTILTTPPDSRSRGECCRVFKRLARHIELPGNLNTLTQLQGHYTPATRTLPEDDTLEALLEALRPTPWGWCYAALATFGCRPAEVPSLVLGEDGTAQCLTVKRRNRLPVVRTTFALPRAWVTRFNLLAGGPPSETHWTHPEDYDSATARRFVDAWRHSRRTRGVRSIFSALAPEFDLYDLRHRWAVRSIEAGLPLTLCARAMGHSAAVHEASYHRHIHAADLRAAMAAASR